MKTTFYISLILAAFSLQLSGNNIAAQNLHNMLVINSVSNDSAYALPFIEDWESHSLNTNQWQTSDDAWAIDIFTGNGGASVKFSGTSNLSNYVSTLTSRLLKGDSLFVGTVTLKFDLKLTDLAHNGTEWLYIKIFDGTDYFTIDSLSNNESFDWQSRSYDISHQVYGNNFNIVFEASGVSSSRIIGWNIDNIEVSRTCDPPTDLEGQAILNWGEPIFGLLSWNTPLSVLPSSGWQHWDSGENSSGISLTIPGNWIVAIRWEPTMLQNIDGDTIKKVKFYLVDTSFDYLVLDIWTGANAANLIYSDTITNAIANMWNDVNISDTVLTIDATKEYRVGYEIVNYVPNNLCPGTDQGPAVSGYGDLIKLPDQDWSTLSQYGLDYNWNLEMYVEGPPRENPNNLLRFNVFRKTQYDTAYLPFDTISFVEGQPSFNSYDTTVASSGIYYACYKVNAVWGNAGDICVSDYAKSNENPNFDWIYILYLDKTDELQDNSNLLIVFPNPTTDIITVESVSTETQKVFTVYDVYGKKIKETVLENENQKTTINVRTWPSGVYLGVLSSKGNPIAAKKFIVTR